MNPAARAPQPEPGQLLGVLIHTFPTGYGFLHVRDGQTDYFIHRRQVENPEHWKRGQEFFFTPEPPQKPGGRPCAGNVIPYVAVQKNPRGHQSRRRPRTAEDSLEVAS